MIIVIIAILLTACENKKETIKVHKDLPKELQFVKCAHIDSSEYRGQSEWGYTIDYFFGDTLVDVRNDMLIGRSFGGYTLAVV